VYNAGGDNAGDTDQLVHWVDFTCVLFQYECLVVILWLDIKSFIRN